MAVQAPSSMQKGPDGPSVSLYPPAQEWAGSLDRLICGIETSVMRPKRFFVSWCGVLVMAYQGFSPAIEQLKRQINDSMGALPRENPGSKWPKTSLGCLKDGVRLTPQQLQVLARICSEESGVFSTAADSYDQTVMVDSLSVVMYECRCLERRLSCQRLPLLPDKSLAGPSSEELANTATVMAEMEAPDYWFHASRDGSREAHYKAHALGVTLVHDLACFAPAEHAAWGTAIPGIVRSFRERVDAELPGLYTWFHDSSLHITIRALMG